MPSITIKVVLVGGIIQFRIGGVPVTGDIVAQRGHKITFECARPFALFIKNFVPSTSARRRRPFAFRSGRGRSESPFDGVAFGSGAIGEISLKVKLLAKLGEYQYGLAVLDGSGHIATHDPRIIID